MSSNGVSVQVHGALAVGARVNVTEETLARYQAHGLPRVRYEGTAVVESIWLSDLDGEPQGTSWVSVFVKYDDGREHTFAPSSLV